MVRDRLISHEALCDALRDYLGGKGITLSGMDVVANLTQGHVQKILAAKPQRIPNTRDMFDLVASCGLAFALFEDAELVALRDKRLQTIGPTALDRWSPAQRELYRQQDRLRPEFYRIAAQRGGMARALKLSSKQRSDIARLAATTRWRKRYQKWVKPVNRP